MAGWFREQIVKTAMRSPEWREVRADRIALDGNQCLACGKTHNLQVHHIKPFQFNPELELDIRNTVTLCGRCHVMIGHLDNWKSYNEHVIMDIVTIRGRIEARP